VVGVIVDEICRKVAVDARLVEALPYTALPTLATIGEWSGALWPIDSSVVVFSNILDSTLNLETTTPASELFARPADDRTAANAQ
jgi:hypothetical protein